MNSINRKQIPICRDHHSKLHHNKLDAFELLSFRNYIRKNRSVHIKQFTKYNGSKYTIKNLDQGEPERFAESRKK